MLRPQPKRLRLQFGAGRNDRARIATIFSSAPEEKVMPTFDLYLPPKAYSRWSPKQHVHPLAAAWHLFASWIERARQRRALAWLDDQMLRDIGITRVEAAREAGRPFWK
jgi:uncharacterized protein YjiS (DUF1127 family)